MLSPIPSQHLQHLQQAHWSPLNQAAHHPHILQNRPMRPIRFRMIRQILRRHPGRKKVPPLVQCRLLLLMLTIIRHTASGRTGPPVELSASEWTTQIRSFLVAWIGQEVDPTVLTALQARPKVGVRPQCRPHEGIMHQYQIAHLVANAVPIRLKLVMSLNFGCYKPRLSPTMLMEVGMSSSYSTDASVSSSKAGTVFRTNLHPAHRHRLYRWIHSHEHDSRLRGRQHQPGPFSSAGVGPCR